MARDHARVFTTIWSDPDFSALNGDEQRLFILLLSQPDLSYCGVLGLTIRRWANLAHDTTREGIEAALEGLERYGFIVVDYDTEEILLRSFMRNDGLLKSPNMTKAAVKAAVAVMSEPIRTALAAEFERVHETLPEPAKEVIGKGLPKGFGKGLVKGSDNPSRTTTTTTAPTPAPSNPFPQTQAPAAEPDLFDEFWNTYPLKRDKAPARKAWAKAIKKSPPGVIIDGAVAYRDDPNREDAYTKYPATWLNAESWSDGPLPERDKPGPPAFRPTVVSAKCPEHPRMTEPCATCASERAAGIRKDTA